MNKLSRLITCVTWSMFALTSCERRSDIDQAKKTSAGVYNGLVRPSLDDVKDAVVSAAVQKGIIVSSVENAKDDLTFLCKGELKTKPIPVSDILVLSMSESGQWNGTLQFDHDVAVEVIVKKAQ